MNRSWIVAAAVLLASAGLCRGQVAGNVSYGQGGGRAQAEQNERNKRVLAEHELPPDGHSMFVEANVLMNVKADEYVAVFGIVEEGETVEQCNEKMNATVAQFTEAVKKLGVADADLFVDFIAQNRIYGFEVTGDLAREKLVGFELKKNVSIHYKDRDLLDALTAAAARFKIFDLIKVDYIVKDPEAVQDQLAQAAAEIIKRKTKRHEALLGTKLVPPAQVYIERPATYYPTGLYDTYTAFEAEQMGDSSIRQRYAVQGARKSRTFYFNGLDGNGFDRVINPVVLEPVVQFTLYLKVRYAIEAQ